MTRPRFFTDQDLNENIILGVLRQEPSVDLVRARDLGMSRRSDDQILAYAARELYIVVSHDLNTMSAAAYARVAASEAMPGLFLVRQNFPIGPIIESLVLIWAASEFEEWKDQVKYLPLGD